MRLLHRYMVILWQELWQCMQLVAFLLITEIRFFKKRKKIEKKIDANIPLDKLGKELKIKGLEVKRAKRRFDHLQRRNIQF